MIDTHCHLTFPDFAGSIDDELAMCAAAGVTGCITISTTPADAAAALDIAKKYPNVWSAAGVHPLYADQTGPGGTHDWDLLRRVASDDRCIAWGELGLDNHYKEPARDLQHRVLAEHLDLIERCRGESGGDGGGGGGGGIDKPVVIHCREAYDDLIPILRRTTLDPTRFVFHCFTGGPADVRKVLDFGAMVSFTGVATYRNAAEVREAARLVPLDRIMVETDAPYLSPEPHRGKRPCHPAWVRLVAESLAATRGEPFERFHEAVNENTRRFFGIEAR